MGESNEKQDTRRVGMKKYGILFLSVLFLSLFVSAEEEVQKEQVESDNVLRFDESLRGEQSKPQISTLFKNKQFNFGKIIKLRENFIPEMNSTLQNLPRE